MVNLSSKSVTAAGVLQSFHRQPPAGIFLSSARRLKTVGPLSRESMLGRALAWEVLSTCASIDQVAIGSNLCKRECQLRVVTHGLQGPGLPNMAQSRQLGSLGLVRKPNSSPGSCSGKGTPWLRLLGAHDAHSLHEHLRRAELARSDPWHN